MKWIFSISIRMENIIFQGRIFTNKDVSLLAKILIKPILTNGWKIMFLKIKTLKLLPLFKK